MKKNLLNNVSSNKVLFIVITSVISFISIITQIFVSKLLVIAIHDIIDTKAYYKRLEIAKENLDYSIHDIPVPKRYKVFKILSAGIVSISTGLIGSFGLSKLIKLIAAKMNLLDK